MAQQTVKVSGTRTIDGREIEWTATVQLSHRPGKLYGPPENCYPDESEAEILECETDPSGQEELIGEDYIIDKAWDAWDYAHSAVLRAEYLEFLRDSKEDR